MPPVKFLRRKWWLSRPFPDSWQKHLEERVPYYRQLPDDLKAVLKNRLTILMHEKIFEGCGGLIMTEEKKVVISAYASILILGASSDYYAGLKSILVYPDHYMATVHEEDEAGIITEGHESRLGESWDIGSVILSWKEIRRDLYGPVGRQNLIFHEFAHQLDGQYGITAGVDRGGKVLVPGQWNQILAGAYRIVQRQAMTGAKGVLDSYGGEHPAELFAVATESFFETPHSLRREMPDLYRMLGTFYKLDPVSFIPDG